MTDHVALAGQVRVRPADSRRFRTVSLAIILLALVARVPFITADNSGFHPTRQFRSAVIAEKIYSGSGDLRGVPKGVAWTDDAGVAILEPPILEAAAAATWHATGGVRLWIPKFLAALVYLLGALVLARELARWIGMLPALIGLALAASIPYGIQATATFQPDPPMVGALLGAVALVLRRVRDGTSRDLYLAAGFAGTASMIKPSAALMMTGVLAALWAPVALRSRLGRFRSVLGALALTWVPAVAWAGFGFTAGFLGGQATSSIIPSLLWSPEFWRGWGAMLRRVVGIPLILAFGVAIAAVLRGPVRRVFVGMLGGYVAFGLIFTYRISTHDYYSLPIVPMIGFGVGAGCAPLATWLSTRFATRIAWALPVVAMLPVLMVVQYRNPIHPNRPADGPMLGRATGHSTEVLFLAMDYGNGEAFFGSMAGKSFPAGVDHELAVLKGEPLPSDRAMLERDCADGYKWFLAERPNLDAEPELRELISEFPLAKSTRDFQLFDLRQCRTILAIGSSSAGPNRD